MSLLIKLLRTMAAYIRQLGRFQRNARLYLISNGLAGLSSGIILVLYNLYLGALGYDADFIGLVVLAATIGAGLAIFPAGLCVDRWSGKWILIGASAFIGVAGAGQMLFRQPTPLLVSALLVGIGAAFVLVVNAPFMTANSTSLERPLLFSLNIVLSLATTVLGELLGGLLPIWLRTLPWLTGSLSLTPILAAGSLARSYQLALLVAGLIAAPSFVPLFLMRSPVPEVHDARHSGISGGFQSRADLPGLMADALKRARQVARASLVPAQWRRVLTSRLCLLVLVQAMIGMGAGLFIPYFNIYFVLHLGASSALFGVIDGGANALNAVLTLMAPRLALRIGKVNTIVVTRLLSLPLLLLIGLTRSLSLAVALYPLRQGLMDMGNGIWQVFSMEEVQEEHRGLANSSYQASYQVAWAVTAPLGGLMITRMGYAPVFIGAALLYLLAIALLWGRFGPAQRRLLGKEKGPK